MRRRNIDDDEALRKLFADGLPEPEDNPWFTRRVLNRLPAKRPIASRVVTVLSVVAAIAVLIGCWCDSWRSVMDSGVVTIDTLVLFCALGLTTVSLAVAPLWTRMMRAV